MNHLRLTKSSNLPGIECFYFIPSAKVVRDPLPGYDLTAGTLVIREIPLHVGGQWYQALVTKHTLRYSGNSKLTASGREFSHLISGVVSKATPEAALILSQFHQQRFVVVYQDRNGYLRMIGSKDYGLLFEFQEDSGQAPGDRNQISFSFSGRSKFPGYFVSGSLLDRLAGPTTVDLGDQTVPFRSLEDGITIRILE